MGELLFDCEIIYLYNLASIQHLQTCENSDPHMHLFFLMKKLSYPPIVKYIFLTRNENPLPADLHTFSLAFIQSDPAESLQVPQSKRRLYGLGLI